MGSVTRVSSSLIQGPSSVEANEFHTEENSLSTSNASDTPSMSPGLSLLSTIKIVTMAFSNSNIQWLCLQSVLKKKKDTQLSNRQSNKQTKKETKKTHTYFTYVYKTSISYISQLPTMCSTSSQVPLTKKATLSSAYLSS